MKVISYRELVDIEGGTQVQKGMNFGIKPGYSIVLMSTQKGAPYNDSLLDNGVIEYEGHDAPRSDSYDKKMINQPISTRSGTLTENGKFIQAVNNYKSGNRQPALVKVYRKIRSGVWVDMGMYELIDTYKRKDLNRQVYKFLLKPKSETSPDERENPDLLHNRDIPGEVMREVFARDKGRCRKCKSTDNLHFDHIIPFSKGGSSKVAENIQLLCARHNLSKGAKLQ